jgi:hypothetical protein
MAPLGQRGTPAIARLDAAYEQVDLAAFTDFLETKGIRLAGRAAGTNLLEWPLGRWAEHRGGGRVTVQPPAGTRVLGPTVPVELASEQEHLGPEMGPIEPHPALGHVPVGGNITYAFGPDLVVVEPSHVATAKTYVSFEGQTAYGQASRIPFHVTSADWQESDRIFAGVLTAFGVPTRVIPIGGSGTFDGVMLNTFSRPRIEGRFTGARMRAWDVEWGAARGDAVIENSYAHVSNAVVTKNGSEIRADGKFSIGYPRKDRGEEIDARVRLVRRPASGTCGSRTAWRTANRSTRPMRAWCSKETASGSMASTSGRTRVS